MYLSHLLINTGDNPDRPRPGRVWLGDLYHVHQRLCMAFPSAGRMAEDPEFLQPFSPDEFRQQVHAKRAAHAGFLFRVDPAANGRVVILVQSAVKPDWEYAFQNANFLLAAPWEVHSFHPAFEDGQKFIFRLLANPIRRACPNSTDGEGKQLNPKWAGKRVPVPYQRLPEWLNRKAEKAGFAVDKFEVVQPGYVYMRLNKANSEGKNRQRNRIFSVKYEGILRVTDTECFKQSLISGIGPAKAFGFGLLSVARISTRE